jgi:uncharacterized protein YigE (DUF2233 family)
MVAQVIKLHFLLALVVCLMSCNDSAVATKQVASSSAPAFISYKIKAKQKDIRLYWQDDKGINFKSIQNLKNYLDTQHKVLRFAMNGGMYKPDYTAQGLFVQNGHMVSALDTADGKGNFYLKPNGVF